VSVEFILLGESFFAQIAFIWLISLMHSLMVFKMRAFDKTSVAEGALVRFNACYTSIVIALALFIPENLTAYIAFIFLWITWHYCYMTTITTLDILVHCHFVDFTFYLIILKR